MTTSQCACFLSMILQLQTHAWWYPIKWKKEPCSIVYI